MSVLIAVAGGLLAGAAVHLLSTMLGLTVTTPGAVFATAIATAGMCQVRWMFKEGK
jgi:hypothetical protein